MPPYPLLDSSAASGGRRQHRAPIGSRARAVRTDSRMMAPMSLPSPDQRPARRALLWSIAGCALGFTLAMGACSNNDSSETVMESIFYTSPPVAVPGGTQQSAPGEPMTLYEKRRLLSRIQQDPRTVQRLTARERRELAAMAAATERDDDED